MGFIIYALLMAVVVWFLVSRMLPAKGVRQLSTSELKELLKDKSCQFIDVRTPQEFKGNHIRGFRNIPLTRLLNQKSKLSKDKEIIVICQTGARSNSATKMLKKQGFTKLTNVKGGLSAWRH